MHTLPSELRFSREIKANHHGWPLLQLLSQNFSYHSSERWGELIEDGCVLLNESVANAQSVVQKGDVLVYIAKNYSEPEVCTDFELIYRDNDFVVVGKSADVPVHKTSSIFWNTFTAILRRALQEPELVPLHRLDRDTSGIMLFARSRDSAKRFQKHLPQFMLRRVYLAVIELANASQEDFWSQYAERELRIDAPLAERKDGEIRVQMQVDPQGKPCTTLFRWHGAQDFRPAGGAKRRVGVVEAELITGRKHQIRAHLAHLNTPILGDPIYSHGGKYYLQRIQAPLDDKDIAILGSKTQMLHAWQLFLHLPAWSEPQWLKSRVCTAEMQKIISAVDLKINT